MKRFVIGISCSLLFLAGCGEIEIPEDIPSPTPSVVASPDGSLAPLPEDGASPSPIINISGSCDSVLEEKNNLAEAIQVAQSELRDCQIQKSRYESLLRSNEADGGVSDSVSKKIIKKYLAEVDQAEYPFDLCGPLGNATSREWYANFTKALEAKNILFEELNRPLKTSDFSRVCASTEGKMAIFIGARAGGKSEFHMVKYSFDTQNIENAFVMEGECEACPDVFGKRRGPYITLSGKVGRVTAEYKYYYDNNILVTTQRCEGNNCTSFSE